MLYWYADKTGLHRGDKVLATAESWGLNDQRGVYHYHTEELAQKCVDDHPDYGLVRDGKTVYLSSAWKEHNV